MGRVRTKTVKRASRAIIEKYYSRLTNDFQVNKRIIDDIAAISTKRLRNKIAGFTTHLMKRLQKGSVTGISLKLQEEQREKKLDYMPDKSAIDTSVIYGSYETRQMIKQLGLIKSINFKDQDQGNYQDQQQQQQQQQHQRAY